MISSFRRRLLAISLWFAFSSFCCCFALVFFHWLWLGSPVSFSPSVLLFVFLFLLHKHALLPTLVKHTHTHTHTMMAWLPLFYFIITYVVFVSFLFVVGACVRPARLCASACMCVRFSVSLLSMSLLNCWLRVTQSKDRLGEKEKHI